MLGYMIPLLSVATYSTLGIGLRFVVTLRGSRSLMVIPVKPKEHRFKLFLRLGNWVSPSFPSLSLFSDICSSW